METRIPGIEIAEVLHFLGWRGTPLDPSLIDQISGLCVRVQNEIRPFCILRRFALLDDLFLEGTSFSPGGADIGRMLRPCGEAVLLAATLGAQSERMLLREQARAPESALLLDAVLSAAIEAVCDEQERLLREQLWHDGYYLTDRYSPGYGDMPIDQTRQICDVLNTPRTIGLTVSSTGIMLPRKSVTAVMGISRSPVVRRPAGCEACSARDTCTMRRNGEECHGTVHRFA